MSPAGRGMDVVDSTVLADDWGVLRKTTFDYERRDGTWRRETRETYDRGNGACILLYDPDRATVLLIKQFRYPAAVNGHPDGQLIEVPAGLLDQDDPETAIRREAAEETGMRVHKPEHLWDVFMSPGSVTERIHFYAAAYSPSMVGTPTGAEGEDIEVVELPFAEALAMIDDGRIRDAKTIMLLQWAALHRFPDAGRREIPALPD
jgi:nudix-type nucleoside diphosphatase (YffH/AdpP family)